MFFFSAQAKTGALVCKAKGLLFHFSLFSDSKSLDFRGMFFFLNNSLSLDLSAIEEKLENRSAMADLQCSIIELKRMLYLSVSQTKNISLFITNLFNFILSPRIDIY